MMILLMIVMMMMQMMVMKFLVLNCVVAAPAVTVAAAAAGMGAVTGVVGVMSGRYFSSTLVNTYAVRAEWRESRPLQHRLSSTVVTRAWAQQAEQHRGRESMGATG